MRCPHHKQIHPMTVLNITSYWHDEDNTNCNFMNVLKTHVEDILVQNVETFGIQDNIIVYTSILTSGAARNKAYEIISLSAGAHLSKQLTLLHDMFSRSNKKDELISDLVGLFGQTVVKNLKICTGQDYTKFISKRKKYAFMNDLAIQDVLDIRDILKKQEAKVQQSIDDILYK